MKRDNTIPLLLVLLGLCVVCGFYCRQGEVDRLHNELAVEKATHEDTTKAVETEYVRVVSAIARTMRCSTESEHAAGTDHECDPSEVEQDAGLTDENGTKLK